MTSTRHSDDDGSQRDSTGDIRSARYGRSLLGRVPEDLERAIREAEDRLARGEMPDASNLQRIRLAGALRLLRSSRPSHVARGVRELGLIAEEAKGEPEARPGGQDPHSQASDSVPAPPMMPGG